MTSAERKVWVRAVRVLRDVAGTRRPDAWGPVILEAQELLAEIDAAPPSPVPADGDGASEIDRTVIYDGLSGEPRGLGACMRGHVYTMPITTRGCPVCDAPRRFKRQMNALVLGLADGDGGMTCSEWFRHRDAAGDELEKLLTSDEAVRAAAGYIVVHRGRKPMRDLAHGALTAVAARLFSTTKGGADA